MTRRARPARATGLQVCAQTGKRIYRTERRANERISHILQHGGEGNLPVRCYQCDSCGKWHLTSKGGLS